MSQIAAMYARVSSERQKDQETIVSQRAALLEYAHAHQYTIPPQWQFEDDGYSGSSLVRPALERLRDLIAEGAIAKVLVYGPDRLSRNYAYQVLLLEEFARHGTEVVLKAPPADTPEQRLLLLFQGMMAEYERAQIAERTRRGKRHRAKAGVINVLSSVAPYGYRYVKKTETAQGYYEVVGSEAEAVRKVFQLYTVEGRSIGSIVKVLNAEKVPTRSRKGPWMRSTVWHLLSNPAYEGPATERRSRHPLRCGRIGLAGSMASMPGSGRPITNGRRRSGSSYLFPLW
jgi:site-specific DNA recombinase